ncbi:MAG: Lrp/AsnC family transcriptional regulator [Promethearchaeota archaeon]|nr:MAG: Lrp/AsnC family transcriptional regulator [Candidatus Lokiarchaeota archaeon]
MSKTKYKLDNIDKKIIDIVQNEPLITHTDISKQVERSQPTIGMRIERLEDMGLLDFQAGLNVKAADLCYARVEIVTNHPEDIFEIVEKCPFMVNAFRLSGNTNVSVILANSEMKHLDMIVNHHFRNNPIVKKTSMNIITEVEKDFVLPMEYDFSKCDCELKEECMKSLDF